jgi:transposase
MQVITIGIDLAKHVFQVHGVDANDKVVFNKPLRRSQVLPFFVGDPQRTSPATNRALYRSFMPRCVRRGAGLIERPTPANRRVDLVPVAPIGESVA